MLAPAKQPLDIAELELHISGSAVVALAGIGRGFHFAQQRVHLLGLEAAAGAHRAMVAATWQTVPFSDKVVQEQGDNS